MADSGGVGTSLEVSVTSIDTRIACNPDSVRDVAAWFYQAYSKVSDAVVEMTGNLLRNPEYWMGDAANAYEEMLNKLRVSAGDLSDRHYRAYEVLRAYAQQLDYHYRDMETIRHEAEVLGLEIRDDYDIMCPPPLPPKPQEPPRNATHEQWWTYDQDLLIWTGKQAEVLGYEELHRRAERVWSDLEEWVDKHLRPLQVESFTLLFAKYFDQEVQGVADRPWQLAVKNALEARADFRAGRSQAQGVGTAVAGIGYATLAYDIATSDTPGQTALAGGAGMAAGAAAGAATGTAVTGAVAAPVAATAAGTIVALGVTSSVGAIYEKAVPLEWRERIDETFWHLPYHLGLANW